MRALEAETKKLEKSFKDLNKENDKTVKSHIKQEAVIHQSVKDHGSLTRSVIANEQVHKSLSRTIVGMSSSLTNVQSNLRRTSSQFMIFARSIEKIQAGNKIGFLDRLMGADRIAKAKANMGEVSKTILTLGANLSAISAVTKLFTSNWGKITGIIFKSSLWAKLASQVVGLRMMMGIHFPAMTAMFGKLTGSFSGLAVNLARRSPLFSRFFANWPSHASNIATVGKNFLGLTTNMSKFLVGTGVARIALNQIGKAAVIASAGFWALGLAAGALKGIGTGLMAIVDMVKQLSGALLLIPGAFMTIGSTVGTVVLGLNGIKDAMKAAFEEDPKKWADAMLKLTPTMRSISNAVRSVAPALKDLRASVQENLLQGFDQDIKKITETFLPSLKTGMVGTAGAIRGIKDQFIGWLTGKENVDLMNQSFSLTQSILNNIAKAIAPLMHGLSQMAIVGQEAIAAMSNSWGSLAQRFDRFMTTARETGKLRMWMNDAITGIKDLGRVLGSTGKLLGTFFRMLGSDGENALARLANTMDRWNKAVQISAQQGGLRAFSNAVQRFNAKGMDLIYHAFVRIRDLITASAPTIEKVFNSFVTSFNFWSSNFVQGYGVVEGFITLIKGLHFEGILGGLIAFIAVQKVMKYLAMPVKAFVAGIAGLGTSLSGVVSGAKPFVSTMGAVNREFGLAKTLMSGAKTAVAGFGKALWAAIGGGVGAALIGTVVAVTLVADYLSKTKAAFKGLGEMADFSKNSVKTFNDAYRETGGLMGKPVLQAAIDQFAKLKETAESVGSNAFNPWDRLIAHLSDVPAALKANWNSIFGGDSTFISLEHQMDNDTKAAKELSKELNGLGVSNEEVGIAVTGTNQQWETWLKHQKEANGLSEKGAEYLQKERDAFVAIQQAMQQTGPGPVNIAKGLEKIKDAAGDAEQKLEGLKQVLIALGWLQDDAADAADALAKKYWELNDIQADAVAKEKGYGNVLIENNKLLTDRYANAVAVKDELKAIADEELRARAAPGANQAKITADTERNIGVLAQKYGIDPTLLIQDYKAEILKAGPAEIQVILTPGGPVAQQVKQAWLQYQNQVDKTQPIKIPFATQETQDFFKSLGINSIFDASSKLLTLPGFAELTQAQKDAIRTRIEQGVNESPTGISLTPSLAPGSVQAAVDANTGGKPATVILQGEYANPTTNNPPKTLPQILFPAGGAKGYPIRPSTPLPPVGTPLAPLADNSSNAVVTALQQAADTIKNIMGGMANVAFQSGLSIVQSLARGIGAGIGSVVGAITNVVKAIAARLPHSPAKTGPFSGTGSPFARGAKTATDYAYGISSNATAAQSAGQGLAQGTVQGLTYGGGGVIGGARYGLGNVVGNLRQMADFTRHLFDLFQAFESIGESLTQFVDNIAKVNGGKGLEGFFPKRYVKQVSDTELLKQREDAAQAAIPDRADQNTVDFQKTVEATPSTQATPQRLGPAPTRDQIIDYIVARGQQMGMTPAQIQAALATANQESGIQAIGMNPDLQGNHQVGGLFQQTPGNPQWGNAADVLNPEHATGAFYEAYKANLAKYGDPTMAAVLTQNPQLLEQAGGDLEKVKLTEYYIKNAGELTEAAKTYDDAIARLNAPAPRTSIGSPLPPEQKPVPTTPVVPGTPPPTPGATPPTGAGATAAPAAQKPGWKYGPDGKPISAPEGVSKEDFLKVLREWFTAQGLPIPPAYAASEIPAPIEGGLGSSAGKPLTPIAPPPPVAPPKPVTPVVANTPLTRPSILNDEAGYTSKIGSVTAAALVARLFPQITAIGGARASGVNRTHNAGLAIDIDIPGWDTKAGKDLGNQIQAFLQANAQKLGIRYTIFNDRITNAGQPSQPYVGKSNSPDDRHLTHIDTQFVEGFTPDVANLVMPAGTTLPSNLTLPSGTSLTQVQPADDQFRKDQANQQILIDLIKAGQGRNLDKDTIAAGVAAAMENQGPGIDPQEQAKKFWDALANQPPGDINERARMAYPAAFGKPLPDNFITSAVDSNRAINDYLSGKPDHLGGGTLDFLKSTGDASKDWLDKNPEAKAALDAINNPNTPDQVVMDTLLPRLDTIISGIDVTTAQGRALKSDLEAKQTAAMNARGVGVGASPVDAISNIAGSATSVVQDIFGVVDSVLNVIDSTNKIGATLVRGVANTKDVNNIIDEVQSYIELGAKIAQSVGDVSSLIGGIVGAAGSASGQPGAGEASAVFSAISGISSIISAVYSSINATIDLIQEGAQIVGSYMGKSLTAWLGLSGVNGDIKYLLDVQEGVLRAYSVNNPEMKSSFNTLDHMLGQGDYTQRVAQVNNQLNVYGSPGMSASDLMDHSMWQVRTAGVGVFGYGSN